MRRWGDRALLAALLLLLGELAARMVQSAREPDDWALLAPAMLLGFLLTDAISGIVHWLCDTFGDERTPLFGSTMIAAFREHHRDPLAITRRSALEVSNLNALAILPILAASSLWEVPATFFGQAFLLSFAGAVYATNGFHRWAHQQRPPRVGRWLQALRLAIPPERHDLHHRRGDRAYCVTTGWLNPLLDRLDAFGRVERLLRAGSIPRDL